MSQIQKSTPTWFDHEVRILSEVSADGVPHFNFGWVYVEDGQTVIESCAVNPHDAQKIYEGLRDWFASDAVKAYAENGA